MNYMRIIAAVENEVWKSVYNGGENENWLT